jgi:hypothetical protein
MDFLSGCPDAYLARPDSLGRKSMFTTLSGWSWEHQNPRGPICSVVRTPLWTPKLESFRSQSCPNNQVNTCDFSCTRPNAHLSHPDGTRDKCGFVPFWLILSESLSHHTIFLKVFHTKTLIYEDPRVQTQIRLRKRDLHAWIYVLTDRFEVNH